MIWSCGMLSGLGLLQARGRCLIACLPLASLLSLCSMPASAQILIDTDFSVADTAVHTVDGPGQKHIKGSAPEGWADNSEWNEQINLSYTRVTEGGRTFLRMHNTSAGTAQLSHPLPADLNAGYYRLRMTARSADRTSATFGIRFAGAPYSWAWSCGPDLKAGWQDLDYSFSLKKPAQPCGIWIVFSGAGEIDLASFKLERRSRDELIQEMKTLHPDGDRGNLLRCSRFPLGLQSGWGIDRNLSDGDEIQVASDPTVIGPSGCPALEMKGPRIKVYAEPFGIALSFEPHVASMYVRGSGQAELVVMGDGQDLAKGSAVLTDHWARLSVPFQPAFMAKVHQLRIEGSGSMWVDAMQVEAGASATPYQPMQRMEVALAVPPSPTAPARVQFSDEPALIDLAVSGRAQWARLQVRVVNVYGQEILLPAIEVGEQKRSPSAHISAGGFVTTTRIRYDVFPEHPLGSYRIEAWVEDEKGGRLGPPNELIVQRLHRPRCWGQDAPDSPFGVHLLSTTRQLLMAKAIGINWARLHDAGMQYIGWSWLEPDKGKWQFFDSDIKRYRKYHIEILGQLETTPGWASSLGHPATGYFDRFLEPTHLPDFANYVTTVVKRYQGVIGAYEVWNEPWGDFWRVYDPAKKEFVRSPTAAVDYAALQKAAYQAAKAVDPEVTILGFNTTSDWATHWTGDVLHAGALPYCDVISYHQYTGAYVGYPGDDMQRGYNEAMQDIVQQEGKVPKPVWLSEGNPVNQMIYHGFFHYTLPFNGDEDLMGISNRVCRFIVSLLSLHVSKAFLYTMHGYGGFGPGPADWRTLVTDDGYLHPSAAAYSAMAWELEGLRFIRTATLAPGVYAYLFQAPNGKRSVAVLATAPAHATYRLMPGAGVTMVDLFGNPQPTGRELGDDLVYATLAGPASQMERALGKTR